MNYAVPINRVIRTNKKLKTVCKLTKEQQAIQEYCRTHRPVVKMDETTHEPYIVVVENQNGRTVHNGTNEH